MTPEEPESTSPTEDDGQELQSKPKLDASVSNSSKSDLEDSAAQQDRHAETAGRTPLWRDRRMLVGGLVGVLVALAIGAGYQYFAEYRPEAAAQKTAEEIPEVASEAAVAILSYKHATVEQDIADAQKLLTGEFADYYSEFTAETVIPAAKEKSVDTQATAVGTAVHSATGDHSVALVFINQETVTADNQTPTQTASSVRVELRKTDGEWRVEKFDPV